MTSPKVFLLDSVGRIGPESAGAVVVSGSHGGTSAAEYVLEVPDRRYPLACFFNDAGGGKDDAGIAGLAMLDRIGVIAATYSNLSARIGDAADGRDNGRLSHLNDRAVAAGLKVGMIMADALTRLGVDS